MSNENPADLFPFQKEGVEFLASRKRACLFDEQGLGKTAQSIRAACSMGAKKILIFCPKSLIGNWKKEIVKWDTQFSVSWTVINWDVLINDDKVSDLCAVDWDVIIGDECHKAIKSWTAIRCRNFILKLAPKAKRIIMMSGTPMTKSAADLHPLLSLMQPGKWGKFQEFCSKYCLTKYNPFKRKWEYYGFKDTHFLNRAMKEIGLRRTKAEKLRELPAKIHSNIAVDLDIKFLKDAGTVDVDTIGNIYSQVSEEDQSVSSLLRAIGIAKVPAAFEIIDNLIEETSPVVVFAVHKEVVEQLYRKLSSAGHRVAFITGDTKVDDRTKLIESFQNGELDVLIGNIQAMGTGHTLTASSKLIFAEMTWSPADMEQAEDRIHRIGQMQCANIYRLYSEDTIEEAMIGTLRQKRKGIEEIIAA